MAERNSEYARIAGDTYVTPKWVYDALFKVEEFHRASDVAPVERNGYDFLADWDDHEEIATNPPYNIADRFVRHAIDQTHALNGKVAMLLPMAWDCARKRRDLWAPPFKAKYALTTRIRWENVPQTSSPSMNHAWFVWDWSYKGTPMMGWLP